MKRKYSLAIMLLLASLSVRADNEVLVGSIDVNSMVSESGGAVVSIPIEVPAGVGGMQPNLSLVYNSQGGYGVAGWGWSLSGLSSITRTGSDQYHDSQIKGITFTNTDNLLLDGNRLMKVSGNNLSAGSVYHTEAESYNKITYISASGGFSVLSKEGLTSLYGNASQSRWCDDGSAILSWNLSRVTDPNGNYVDYTYDISSQPSESWLSRIDYTGNVNSTPTWNVRFSYIGTPHRRVFWRDEHDFAVGKLLKTVSIYNGNVPVYRYELTYDSTYVEPRLLRVQKIATNGDAYEPTVISWAPIGSGAFMSASISTSRKENILYGDFNGDGRTDIFTYSVGSQNYVVYYNDSNGLSLSFRPYTYSLQYSLKDAQIGDYNGDGKTDIIGRKQTGSDNSLVVLQSTGEGFTPLQICNMLSSVYSVGDFNGDGRSEIVTGGNNMMIYGSSITAHSVTGITMWSNTNGNAHTLSDSNAPLDFDGDGKTDLLLTNDTELKVFRYDDEDHEFIAILNTEWSSLGYSDGSAHYPYFGDFNGDGLTDIGCVMLKESGLGNYEWQFRKYIFTGYLGLGQAVITTIPNYLVHTADVNSDGLTDICNFWPDGDGYRISVGLSNGETFALSQSMLDVTMNISSLEKVCLMDLTSDGLPELVDFDNASVIYAKQIYQQHPLLVNSIIDGYGNACSYSYKPLTDSSVYENNQSPSDNTLPLVGPLYVVSTYNAPYVSLTYKYKNGIVHKYGKGFLGFKEREVRDLLHERISCDVSDLNSTYFNLYPVSSTVKSFDGDAVSSTNYQMNYVSGTNHVYFRYPSRVVSRDYLTTLKDSVFQTVDSYGNVNLKYHIMGDREEITMSSYSAVSSWCNNKPTNISKLYYSNEGVQNGGSKHYFYDTRGNLAREVTDSTSTLKLVRRYSYDTFGNCTGETVSGSGQTRTTSVSWSSDGRFPVTSTDELGLVTTLAYDDATGVLLSSLTAEGSTTYTYDSFGRQTSSTDPLGDVRTTSMEYVNGISGLKYSVTETCTHQSPVTTWYNAYGQPLYSMTIGFGDHKVFTAMKYDMDGSKKLVSEPFFANSLSDAMSRTFTSQNATLYTYDEYGRTETILSPADSVTYSYNGLTTIVSSRASKTSTKLNASGLVEERTLYDGGLVPIPIPDGPIRSIPNHNKKITYTYESSGRVKTITPQGGGTITLAYDIHGNRTSMVDPDAGTVTDSYNAFDQHTSHSQNIHGAGRVQTTYTYDTASGRLLSETVVGNDNSSKQYAYHAQFKDLVSCITDQDGNHVSYSYDSKGRLIREERTSDGPTLVDTYAYSGGHITQHGYIVDNVTKTLENFTYDGLGNMIRESLVNNSSNIWELLETNARGQVLRERKGSIVTTYTYDNAGRVLTISAPGIQNLTYTYDENGNTLTKEDAIANHKAYYSYDGMNRLTSWRTESPYPHSLLDSNSSLRLPPPITNITHTITYDEETGNIIGKSDLGSNATFTYDPTNKPHALRSVSNVATDWGSDTQDITYTDLGMVESIEMGDDSYDIQYAADGRRIKSHLHKGDGGFTTRYYGNGLEKAISGVDNIDYLTYLCHGAIVVHHEGSGGALRAAPPTTPTTILQAYYDAQGSMVALVDYSGNVIARFAYDPWGKRVKPTDWTQSATSTEPYHINRGYTMHEHLEDFGLINMNGRVFDPAVAQFLSPDNYIQSDGNWLNYNRYAYCLNNPLIYIDENGECWHIIAGAVVGGGLNLLSNWNNCDRLWEYFTAFGAGAAAGALTAAFPNPTVSALCTGGLDFVNNVVAQCDDESTNVDWGEAIFAGIGGAIGGYASPYMGQIGAKLGVRVGMTMLPNGTCKAIGYISSTMSGALGGFAGDFLGDFISTTGLECMHGNDLVSALRIGAKTGFRSGAYGAVQGGIVGCIQHAKSEHRSKKIAKEMLPKQSDVAASLSTLKDGIDAVNNPTLDLTPQYTFPKIPRSPFSPDINSINSVPLNLDIESLWRNFGYLWYLEVYDWD